MIMTEKIATYSCVEVGIPIMLPMMNTESSKFSGCRKNVLWLNWEIKCLGLLQIQYYLLRALCSSQELAPNFRPYCSDLLRALPLLQSICTQFNLQVTCHQKSSGDSVQTELGKPRTAVPQPVCAVSSLTIRVHYFKPGKGAHTRLAFNVVTD